MSIIGAIILGIIQGLTEFIPVSSSGHLVLAHHFFGATRSDLAFDVALHIGTLLALLLFFGKDLLGYIQALFVKGPKTKLSHLLILATIPAALAGYVLESTAESAFRSPLLVSINLIVVGLVMILAEIIYTSYKNHSQLEKISTKQALVMGFSQALAIVPGVSRSGSTIAAGLFMGVDRVAATRFSFLLGIPIISGAILKVLTEAGATAQFGAQLNLFIIGILTAFLSGLFAIRFMLKFLASHGLQVFAYYRIGLAAIVLLLLWIG